MATGRLSHESARFGGISGDVPAAFRLLFRQHNREVAIVSIFAFGLALAGWSVLFAFVFWAAAIIRTLTGMEGALSRALPVWFLPAAIFAIFVTGMIERIHPPAERAGRKFFRLFTFVEALLFVPQLTLTALQNLRAFVFLRRQEMRIAWQVAQLVAREETVPLHTVSGQFCDPARTQRALAALQSLGILKFHPEGADWLLSMPNAQARKICQQRVRLRV